MLESSAETEKIACLVAEYFCLGYPPVQIAEVLRAEHGLDLTREAPYRYLAYCTARRYLRFLPPPNTVLAEQTRRRFPHLLQVDVADAATTSGVMERAAEMALDLIREKARHGKATVRIGCAGGDSMALLVRKLVDKLSQPQAALPREIICQNLVAGFDLEDPTTNPIGFLAPLVGPKASGVEIKCVLFQAPALVHPGQRDALLKLSGNNRAAESVQHCDIIMTSCGGIDDKHQMLQKYYSAPGTSIEFLKSRGCVGDMLWLPLCEDGPLRFELLSKEEKPLVPYRTMSLIELSDLPGLIRNGTDVVLAVGPCSGCLFEPFPTKGPILRAILHQVAPIVTHLVTNTEIANFVLRDQGQETAPAPRRAGR